MYILAIICTTIVLLFAWRHYNSGRNIDQKVAGAVGIAGLIFACIGMSGVVKLALSTAIDRMGAERPRSVTPSELGGWELDRSNTHVVFLLFGEIEVNGSISPILDAFFGVSELDRDFRLLS